MFTTETQRAQRKTVVFPCPGDDGQAKEPIRLRLKRLSIIYAITIALMSWARHSCPKGMVVLGNRRLPIGQKKEKPLCSLCLCGEPTPEKSIIEYQP